MNTENTLSAHIYVCHHSNGNFFTDDVFTPIQVGRATSSIALQIPGDDTGDNLSSRNAEYCELTAVYWAWKNDHADWVGLMHYRRFLDFAQTGRTSDRYGCIPVDLLDQSTQREFGLDAETVIDLLRQHQDIGAVVPKKWSVRKVGFSTLEEHYSLAPHHYAQDLSTTRAVLAELFPGDEVLFDEVMASSEGYFTNIFLLRRDLFQAYCEWLFAILFEVERRCDLTNYSAQARRVYGYLGERLFNVFMAGRVKQGLATLELDRVFFKKQTMSEKVARIPSVVPPRPPAHAVTIVIASDNNFVPHLAALMESIKASFAPDRFLDLVVLDGGIEKSNKLLLERQFGLGLREGGLHFLDCKNLHADIATHMHFSVATFYRISIGELLPNHDKALYIDCDTIVLADVSTLFDIPLDGKHVVAAAPDIIMKSFINRGTPALLDAGGQPASLYLRHYVGLGDEAQNYFQAGVMLFDLDSFRRLDVGTVAISDLSDRKYWFLDQDVLNKHLKSKVRAIDTAWNCVNSVNDICDALSADWAAKAREDFACPRLVHYAGFEAKPWNNRDAPLAHFYWFFLRRTFWYESVIAKFQMPNSSQFVHTSSKLHRMLSAIWRRLPRVLRKSLGGLAHFINGRV